jgi:hypothetical protein
VALSPKAHQSIAAKERIPRYSAATTRFVTPHAASYSVEALEELQTNCATDVAPVLSVKTPAYPMKMG